MTWKTTPEAWTKAFWWNMKNLNKNMDWRKHEGKSNPIIPKYIIQHLYAILKEFKASEESPAVLARGKPMNPTGEADEGGGEGKRPERLWCHHPGSPTNPHSRGLRPISSSL
jgi:hypothetical protein